MRKTTNFVCLTLLICIFMLESFSNLNIASAIETSSETKLSLEQSCTNFDLIHGLGYPGAFTYYDAPTINSESLNHDLTRVSISNLQRFTTNQTAINHSSTYQNSVYQNISEYECSAPFDTQISVNLEYNASTYSNYSTSYSQNATLISGSLGSLNSDDTTYLVLNSSNPIQTKNGASINVIKGTLSEASNNIENSYSAEHAFSPSYDNEFTGAGDNNLDFEYTISSLTANKIYYLQIDLAINVGSLQIDVYNSNNEISLTRFGLYQSGSYDEIKNYFSSNGISKIKFTTYSNGGIRQDCYLDRISIIYNQTVGINSTFNFTPSFSLLNSSIPVVLNVKAICANSGIFQINNVVYSTPSTFTDFNLVLSSNYQIQVIFYATNENNPIQLQFDYLFYYPTYDPVSTFQVVNFQYFNDILKTSTITLTRISIVGNQTWGNITYRFDSSVLDYDYSHDLIIQNQSIRYDIATNIQIKFAYFTEYSTNEYVVPTEVDLTVNDVEIEDESFNSGFCTFLNYQNLLNFTSNTQNVIFNFTVLVNFNYNLNLDIKSRSYYSKTLTLAADDSLSLTECNYLFNASIKHSYINNHDYSTAKTIYPVLTWLSGSIIKIECILNDDAYIHLDRVATNSNQSSIAIYSQHFNSYSLSSSQTLSLNIPTGFQSNFADLAISNLMYTEPYTHIENNSYRTYEETQNYPTFSESISTYQDAYTSTEKPAEILTQEMQTQNEICTEITNSSENFEYYNIMSSQQQTTLNQTNATFIADYQNTVGMIPDSTWKQRGSYTFPSNFNANIDDHNSTIYLNNPTTYQIAISQITPQNNVYVETWLKVGDVNQEICLQLVRSDFLNLGGVAFHLGKLKSCHAGSYYDDLGYTPSSNTWYHIAVNWTKNSYQYIYINGTLIGSTTTSNDDVSYFHILVQKTNAYYDAICSNVYSYVPYTNLGSNTINQSITFNLTQTELKSVCNFTIESESISNRTIQLYLYNYATNSTQLINNTYITNHKQSIYAQNYFTQQSTTLYMNLTLYCTSRNLSQSFNFSQTILTLQISLYNLTQNSVSPNVVLSYSKSVRVGQANNISIQVQKTLNQISKIIFWDNISNSFTELGTNDGYYNKLLTFSTSRYYSFSVFVNDSANAFKRVNVTNVFVAKNSTDFYLEFAKTQIEVGESTEYTFEVLNFVDSINLNLTFYDSLGNIIESSISTLYDTVGRQTYTYDSLFYTFTKTQFSYGWHSIFVEVWSDCYVKTNLTKYIEIIPAKIPDFSISYQKMVQVGQTNTIGLSFDFLANERVSYYYIDSLTNDAQLFDYTVDEDETSITINAELDYTLDISQSFNVSIQFINGYEINDEFIYSSYRIVNLTNLFVAKNHSQFVISNLYQQYYQNSTLNINTTSNHHVSLKIYKPDASILNSSINNSICNLMFNQTGYYLVNATFESTNQYLSYSIETLFEVLPISRSISISELGLTVNTHSITSLTSRIYLNSDTDLIFDFVFGASFDIDITLHLRFNDTFVSSYQFQFNQTSMIDSIFINNVSITNIAFQSVRLNGQVCTNYTLDSTTLFVDALANQTFYNADDFSLLFLDESVNSLIQLDSSIATTSNSIDMNEYFETSKSFVNWYFDSNYTVNSASATHLSSSSTMSITNLDSNYYFSYNSNAGDLYLVRWDLDPEFSVSYSIVNQQILNTTIDISISSAFYIQNVSVVVQLPTFYDVWSNGSMGSDKILRFDIDYSSPTIRTYRIYGYNLSVYTEYDFVSSNGTFTQIDFTAIANFPITNYATAIELFSLDIYQENWTCSNSNITNLVQNSITKRLTFLITSITDRISISLVGQSSVPEASISRYVMARGYEIDVNTTVVYSMYLQYSKSSTQYYINLGSDWVLDGVHYGTSSYDVAYTSGYFTVPGFGSSISSSYLNASVKPIQSIQQIMLNNTIYVYINSSLPLNDSVYYLTVDLDESYDIICDYETLSVTSKLLIVSGIDLDPGMNVLVFTVQTVDMSRNFWFLLPILLIAVGYCIYYVYRKNVGKDWKLSVKKYFTKSDKKSGVK